MCNITLKILEYISIGLKSYVITKQKNMLREEYRKL